MFYSIFQFVFVNFSINFILQTTIVIWPHWLFVISVVSPLKDIKEENNNIKINKKRILRFEKRKKKRKPVKILEKTQQQKNVWKILKD